MQTKACKPAVEERVPFRLQGQAAHYWRCLAVAARLTDAARRDSGFAAERLSAYANEADLDLELVHAM